jgi:hypothetical protein
MSGRTNEVNECFEGVAAFIIEGNTRQESRSGE